MRMICLDIPVNYKFLDQALIDILKRKVGRHLQLEAPCSAAGLAAGDVIQRIVNTGACVRKGKRLPGVNR